MRKTDLLSAIFLIIDIIAVIPLITEGLENISPNTLITSAIALGAGLIGIYICVLVKFICEPKKEIDKF